MFAGILVLLFQPFILTLPILLYRMIRKSIGIWGGLCALPFIWITYEWLYALSEFAFPWLTLGNTQTYSLSKIQYAELTGVYGISLWVMILNILFFLLLLSRTAGTEKQSIGFSGFLIAAIVLLYNVPDLY
jgi:apolipoprotein N-acyltransferase